MAEESLNLEQDEKAQKKEEKKRKKEEKKKKKQENGEEEEESGGKLVIVFVTFIIVVIWLGIFALLIRLDVGGFGSTVLHPILKDVPYVNKILPDIKEEENTDGEGAVDVQYPYKTIEQAIARIKELELELSNAQEVKDTNGDSIEQLQAEIKRLQEFEIAQAEFLEEKTKFYEEVVFSDEAPDINEYINYYESIDAANAAELYKQAVQKQEQDKEIKEYANTYANMKPKQAAAIMEQLTNDLKLVAQILENMDVKSRADILGAMNSEVAARVTELMEP